MSERDLALAAEKLNISQSRLKGPSVIAQILPIRPILKLSVSLKKILDPEFTTLVCIVPIQGQAMYYIPSGNSQRRCYN